MSKNPEYGVGVLGVAVKGVPGMGDTLMVENVAGTLCHESHDLSHVISLSKDAGTNCRKKAILRVTGTKCREDAEV